MNVIKEKINTNVDEFTTPSPITVFEDSMATDAGEIMEKEKFRHLPVVDANGKPVGLLSERDLQFVSDYDLMKQVRVGDLMTPMPYVVPSDTPLSKVAMEMSKNKFGSAIVTYENNELGIFTSTDALNALVEFLRE